MHSYNLRPRNITGAPSPSASGSSNLGANASRTPQTTTPRTPPLRLSLWRRAGISFEGKTPTHHGYNLRSSSTVVTASNEPGPILRDPNASTAQGAASSSNAPPKPSLRRRAGVNLKKKNTPARNLRLPPLQKTRGKKKSTLNAHGTAGSSSRAVTKLKGGIQKPTIHRLRLTLHWVTCPEQRFRVRHFLATQVTVLRLETFQSTREDLLAALADPIWITTLLCKTIHSMKVALEPVKSLQEVDLAMAETSTRASRPVVVWFDDRAGKRRIERARPNYRSFRPAVTDVEWKQESFLLFVISQRICFAIGKYNRCDQTDLNMCRTVLDSVTSDIIYNASGVDDPFAS